MAGMGYGTIISGKGKMMLAAPVAGIAGAGYFAVRNEALLVVVIFTVTLLLNAFKCRKFASLSIFIISFLTVCSIYTAVNFNFSEHPVFSRKLQI